jgi:hypothetical protein
MNKQSLDICENRCSGFLPLVVTYFTSIVWTYRDLFRRIGMRQRVRLVCSPNSPATVQIALSSFKLRNSLSKVEIFRASWK